MGVEKGVIDIPKESRMTQPVAAQNGILADKGNITQSDSTSKSIVPNTEKSVPAQNLKLGSHPRDATEDEVATLPHVTDRIPIAAWIVILAGAAERATYFGVIAPWRAWTSSSLPICRFTTKTTDLEQKITCKTHEEQQYLELWGSASQWRPTSSMPSSSSLSSPPWLSPCCRTSISEGISRSSLVLRM